MLDALASFLGPLAGSRPSDLPDDPGLHNPLPPCPGSPNCVRVSRSFPVPPDRLRRALLEALRHTGAREISTGDDSDQSEIEAVYRAGLFFDDVLAQVEPGTGGDTEAGSAHSALHLRSASRVGNSDLGVNRRRIRHILRRLEGSLAGDPPPGSDPA